MTQKSKVIEIKNKECNTLVCKHRGSNRFFLISSRNSPTESFPQAMELNVKCTYCGVSHLFEIHRPERDIVRLE